ncbi:hypothetical protein GCM10010124_35820 [Pilimelia terevasa]|uniref:Protein-arginine deiminase C-terminal domain-containing protein n=1 Tax=Pilimelia terevasa TaxID=53372 RepID=A0A8J3FKG3_9ACTN|nr:protein-arginine deiminase family protein [Pilimelia terevasa]GGK39981.1 hypothetical protein GCM10010124_35820 [Pilimelia terevasa]
MPRARQQVSTWAAVACLAAVAPPAAASAAGPAGVTIRADSNRDGAVDLTGATDEEAKGVATATRGALFLPNLDDDAKRCASRDQACADAADAVVNGDEDARDLAPLRTVPTAVAADASATVVVEGAAANYTRLFAQRGTAWTEVTRSTTFTADDLRRGLVLGLEGRDIVRDPAKWDGTARVTLAVDGAADSVLLRVAPMLTHAHTQTNQQLTAAPGSGGDFGAFRRDLEAASSNAKLPRPVHFFGGGDIWAQDWFEPTYVSMPAGGGTQQIRLLMRSDQAREAQNQLYALRGAGVGVVRLSGAGRRDPAAALYRPDTFNSFGNLETIPPYRNGGKEFPAGRMVMGEDPGGQGPSALQRRVLAAQGAQEPLYLDSGWLQVGHVDEFLQFLPATSGRGWRFAVADPRGAVALLRRAAETGSGGTPLSSHRDFRRMTISAFLADKRLAADQETAAKKIDAALARVKAEVGLADAEIVRIPTLYQTEGGGAARGPGQVAARGRLLASTPGLRERLAGATPAQRDRALRRGAMGALLPAAINSIVAAPGRMIVARQWGPVVGGRDLLAEAVTQAYQAVGLSVEFVDDYTTYHVGQGEVHCATNSLRDTTARWWQLPAGR